MLARRLARSHEYVAHNVISKDPASTEPTWAVENARFVDGPAALVVR
jgi:hypothetical protein